MIFIELAVIGALDRIVIAARIEFDPPTVVLLEKFLRIFDVNVGNAPTLGQQINMRQRSRRFGGDYSGDRWKLHRHFIQNKNFVEADLNVVIEFGNDVNSAETFGHIECLILLILCNL